MTFNGFPANVRHTPVPDPLLNNLLTEIEDLAEYKVTLRAIWLLAQKRGAFRSLAEEELVNDPTLLQGLKSPGGDPRERAREGLRQAVARRTLLRHEPGLGREQPRYLLNTEANRRELARRQAGGASGRPEPPRAGPGAGHSPGAGEVLEAPAGERPNIFSLYEDNIGTIGVVIAEELRDAEENYPRPWIAEAFQIAILENKRNWRYISAILRRWAAEGKLEPKAAFTQPPKPQPGVGVKAGATLWEGDGRQHGEPGRHSPADNRSNQPRSRQRR